MWARSKSTFYLQLEDDIVAKSGFLSFIKTKVLNEASDWFLMEFSNLGFIGKLFRSESLTVSPVYTCNMVTYRLPIIGINTVLWYFRAGDW